jgi:mannose-6-phosphate isomerase-like protein (cupin superfamily)
VQAIDKEKVESAEIVIPCARLAENLEFFTEILGFRIDVVYPADAPRVAVISAYGCRLRLEKSAADVPGTLLLSCESANPLTGSNAPSMAPNGMRVEFELSDSPPVLPPLLPSVVVKKMDDEGTWGTGRAGMQYRDLIPDRLGGRYIASHIRIPNGGPVPDYVHHHHIIFQLIYCYKGWVRVVYEDQGPPFVMQAGDCVLQPPHIRHRVLECSDGFEVVEIGGPAEHATLVDHNMQLPTTDLNPDRDFGGQRFCFHKSANASWSDWRMDGFEMRDTGIAVATDNIVSVAVIRPTDKSAPKSVAHSSDLLFNFVLKGSLSLEITGIESSDLVAGDSYAIPAGMNYVMSNCSDDLEFLEVMSPAVPATTSA